MTINRRARAPYNQAFLRVVGARSFFVEHGEREQRRRIEGGGWLKIGCPEGSKKLIRLLHDPCQSKFVEIELCSGRQAHVDPGSHGHWNSHDSCDVFRRLTLYRLVGEYDCKDMFYSLLALNNSKWVASISPSSVENTHYWPFRLFTSLNLFVWHF